MSMLRSIRIHVVDIHSKSYRLVVGCHIEFKVKGKAELTLVPIGRQNLKPEGFSVLFYAKNDIGKLYFFYLEHRVKRR